MFNDDDEVRSALAKMYEYEYSPLDGFVEISQGLGSMIKSSAYEPSMGLFYVQQHAHEGIPNLVNLRSSIVVKSREISLHTEDSQDSIKTVRSMKDFGFPIVDDMISDISKSLAIMSSKQRRKGLIGGGGLGSGFGTGRISSWGRAGSGGNVNDVQKASACESSKQMSEDLNSEDGSEAAMETANGSANAMQVVGEELPVSSCILIGDEEEEEGVIKKQDLRNG